MSEVSTIGWDRGRSDRHSRNGRPILRRLAEQLRSLDKRVVLLDR